MDTSIDFKHIITMIALLHKTPDNDEVSNFHLIQYKMKRNYLEN